MEAMGRLIREMETGLCHSPVIAEQMETLAKMLEDHKVKKVYGYLKKPVKAQVDAIVDELAKVPEVAECYEQWNQLRDELERYYKDAPRERDCPSHGRRSSKPSRTWSSGRRSGSGLARLPSRTPA